MRLIDHYEEVWGFLGLMRLTPLATTVTLEWIDYMGDGLGAVVRERGVTA